MPAITYKEFSGGLDRRLPIGVQDANRLWTLKNAYITSGHKIHKRPALKLVSNALSGSVGLASMNGELALFASTGSTFVAPSGMALFKLDAYNPSGGATTLTGILWAGMFQAYPYVVATHYTQIARTYPPGMAGPGGYVYANVVRHHYIDGGATKIVDVNCPHGASVTKAAGRIFSIGSQIVSYCAAGSARDWTTASDAGFLPVSLQQDTTADPTAVGTFEDTLVVMFEEGSQVWDVATDPSANQVRRRMYGVGTKYAQSLASFYRDLTFCSAFGVRSMSVQEVVNRFDETDVGVPIDSLVVAAAVAHDALGDTSRQVMGVWIPQFGQYWLVFAQAAGASRVFAYSFSRSSKLAAWSEYTFPIAITGIATLAGKVYVRDATSLYELDPDTYTDNGTLVDVDVQMAYQDAKQPGVEKMFYGADFVFSGTADVSYLYDPRDQTKETIATPVTGDSRPSTIVPVEVSAAAIAPRFRHSADEAFTVDMASLYFHSLTVQTG